MEYIEIPEWKELKKAKKYKEAADKLMYEIAVNLMMVHNKYSDVKYDPYKMCSILDYGKDSNENFINQIEEFLDIFLSLSSIRFEYNYEQSKKTIDDYKEILKETQNIKKVIAKVYSLRNKKNNW